VFLIKALSLIENYGILRIDSQFISSVKRLIGLKHPTKKKQAEGLVSIVQGE
jgi:hypothetical protein